MPRSQQVVCIQERCATARLGLRPVARQSITTLKGLESYCYEACDEATSALQILRGLKERPRARTSLDEITMILIVLRERIGCQPGWVISRACSENVAHIDIEALMLA